MVRDNSCKCCDNTLDDVILSTEENEYRDEYYLVYINNNLLTLIDANDNGSSYLGDKVINYCPMCGRKLYGK